MVQFHVAGVSWDHSLLHEKACEVVIVYWSRGETGQVCKLCNVLCCFIISDLPGQAWQLSKHSACMHLRSSSNRVPVVHGRKNRCERFLISAIVLAEKLFVFSAFHVDSGWNAVILLSLCKWFQFVMRQWPERREKSSAYLACALHCCVFSDNMLLWNMPWLLVVSTVALLRLQFLFVGRTWRSTGSVRDTEIMIACQVLVDCWPGIFYQGVPWVQTSFLGVQNSGFSEVPECEVRDVSVHVSF